MLSAFIIIPFFSILIFNLPFVKVLRKAALAWVVALSIVQIVLSFLFFSPEFLKNFGQPGHFFNFNLSIDGLSVVMLLCIGIVQFVTLIIGAYTITEEKRIFGFINLLLFIFCGLNGMCLVRGIFSLYVFLEIAAVASYILIVFDKGIKAFAAAFKYIILSTVASVLMLSAIALMLLIAGDTRFLVISQVIKSSPHSLLIMLSMALFVCASFIKAGAVPFHGWVAEVYSHSPATVSILLAGIVSKMLGVYTLIRVVKDVFGFNVTLSNVFLVIGTITIIAGALVALIQKDFKKILSYSSISQVGYIILGLGSGNPLGIAGAIFHFFNHSIFKSLLFVNSASLESRVSTTNIKEMGGLSKNMPITGLTSIIAMLSASGVPPFAGFWSKLLIVMGLFAAGNSVYAVIAILSSLLTLAYFLYMQRMVFFGKINERLVAVKEAGFGLVFPAMFLAAIIILTGLFYPFVLEKFILSLVN